MSDDNDGTAMSGIDKPKHKPFAVETPMRNPVYEPGPDETETAAIFSS